MGVRCAPDKSAPSARSVSSSSTASRSPSAAECQHVRRGAAAVVVGVVAMAYLLSGGHLLASPAAPLPQPHAYPWKEA